MQEQRTAGSAEWLRQHGYEVTEKIGGTGVVGLLRNGEGATVLLRADMDALPMKENSGLPYASTKTGKARHRCGNRYCALVRARHARHLADGGDRDPGPEP